MCLYIHIQYIFLQIFIKIRLSETKWYDFIILLRNYYGGIWFMSEYYGYNIRGRDNKIYSIYTISIIPIIKWLIIYYKIEFVGLVIFGWSSKIIICSYYNPIICSNKILYKQFKCV